MFLTPILAHVVLDDWRAVVDRPGYVSPLIGREPIAYNDWRSLVLLLEVLAGHSVRKRVRKRYV